jgi:CheY-like chemotaxis protein
VLLHLNALARDLPRLLGEARERGEDETATRLELLVRRATEAREGVVRIEALVKSLRAAVVPEEKSMPPPTTTTGRTGRLRLLIVEDEPELGDVLRATMAEEHDVVLVTGAAEALAFAIEADPPFDAILCDLVVADGSGIDLHEELRRRAPGAEQRMIFMSGGAYTDRAREFLDSVPNPRIVKPFSIEQLRAMLPSKRL